VNREYRKWFSPLLNREMELLVFGRSGARVIVFPTRQGRFFDFENWGLVEALREPIQAGRLQLFCVDSVDSESLYGAGAPPPQRIARHNQYEQYILKEVVPLTSFLNPSESLVALGCSIGAYHAVNVAFRHPGMFRRVVGLSGRYDLTQPIGCYQDLFDGHYDSEIYFHTPNHFVPNLEDHRMLENLRSLDIRLAVGESDYFCESNRKISQALWQKGVWHSLDIWPGTAHKAYSWRQMVGRYFGA
jgi:esterase/lipase superfamily enzyme